MRLSVIGKKNNIIGTSIDLWNNVVDNRANFEELNKKINDRWGKFGSPPYTHI